MNVDLDVDVLSGGLSDLLESLLGVNLGGILGGLLQTVLNLLCSLLSVVVQISIKCGGIPKCNGKDMPKMTSGQTVCQYRCSLTKAQQKCWDKYLISVLADVKIPGLLTLDLGLLLLNCYKQQCGREIINKLFFQISTKTEQNVVHNSSSNLYDMRLTHSVNHKEVRKINSETQKKINPKKM